MTTDAQSKGFTLIELIVFIVVAGIFIPMAYIAFQAATRGSMTPETTIMARFLAEKRLEEITNDSYTSILPGDSGWNISTEAGYQWRWTVQNVAYRGLHGSPESAIPDNWQGIALYRVGDYVKPTTSSTTFYRCFPHEFWQGNQSYNINAYVSPNPSNNYSYQARAPLWESNHDYSLGEYVEPTAGNSGVAYQCLVPGRSGLFEPSPWPTTGQVSDGMVTWQATQQVISGPTEPSPWPTTNPAFDARIRWIPVQMQSGGSPPSWPSSNTDPINDGTLRWRLSMVYKKITVYVNDPNGNQYVATTILTARPGGAYP